MRRRIRSGGALAAAIATTALLIHAPTHVDAGLSIGGVTSTDACYAALQSAKRPGENVVDTDGYVAFINELSDGAFTAFQYNEEEDKWDFYPVGDFEQLPAGLKGEFYKHACGGEYVICPNAFLYTDGTDGSDLDPQQEIYLYQVCVGVEGAIDEARPDATPPTPPTPPTPAVPSQPTYPPTAPPPTPEPVELYTGEQQLQLTYRAVVSPDVSSEDLRSPESDTRKDLLGAMTSWSFMTGNDYYKQSNVVPEKRMLGGVRERRKMLKKEPRTVRPKPLVADPSEQELMQIVDVDCDGDMDMLDHHCIEVTTNLTLIFEDEPPGSEMIALQYFEDSFETDVTDGTFYGLISPKSQQTVKAVYLPMAENVADTGTDPAPADPDEENGDDFDELIDGLQRDNLAEENTGDGGGSNVAGIVSGVVVGLVVVGMGLFLYRRRRQQLLDDDGSYKKKSMKDGFDPADDLEGGRAYSDGSSSHDEFSHSSSQSSSSVASYSGSEGGSSGSSDSSTSYTSSSREHSSSYSQSYSSREHGSSYSTSGTGTEGNSVGPPSVSASESMSHSASETDSYDNSPYNSGSGAAENRGGLAMSTQSDLGPYEAESGSSYASSSSSQRLGGAKKGSRSTRTDDDSSAGSSGWDSSDGDSSVDTGSVDSYDPNTIKTGDLSGSTSQSPSADGSSTLDEGNMPAMVNPAVNPVVQRGVTMIPIQESDNEDSTAMASSVSDESSNPSNFGRRRDEAPLGGDIQEAIEKGDWAAVGATAAILASDSSAASTQNDDNMTRDSSVDPSGEVSLMSGGSNTVDEDDERAAEIDQLVETGNWDGVVAVAARYADEADEADESLSQPLRSQEGSSDSPKITKTVNSSMYSETSVESAGSVSVETADASSSAYDTMSDASHSVYSSMESASASASGTDSRSPSNPDTGTQSSSITSSYVSGGGITSSMFSADVSSVGVSQEKRQMSAYRAEVEALVRRVVPDEIDNVDDIMVQFSGREEELIETLRAMQEKSIAQRARAAVAKSAKREAGRTGRDMHDESSEDLGHSVNTEDDGQSTVSYATDGQSLTTDGQSYTTGQSGRDGSITVDDDYSTGSSRSSSGSGSDSSYSSRSSRSSGASGTEYSESQMSGSPEGKSKDGLSDAIDASDWRAVGKAAEHMRADGVASSRDLGTDQINTEGEFDDLIEDGNWSGIVDAASNMAPSPDDLD